MWLAAIYDYDKLNDYGKTIIEQVSEMTEKDKCEDGTAFSYKIKSVKNCQDMEYRMKVATAIVVYLNERIKTFTWYKLYFIFWALMVLTVDDANKEEHLSLICDFAKMLKVSDTEITDMVQIIQAIYNIEGNYKIQTEEVALRFREVMEKYGIRRFYEQ